MEPLRIHNSQSSAILRRNHLQVEKYRRSNFSGLRMYWSSPKFAGIASRPDSALMPLQVNRMRSAHSLFREQGRMRAGSKLGGGTATPDDTTTASLRLMLSYVEAECLRIGPPDAAKHAALAAA